MVLTIFLVIIALNILVVYFVFLKKETTKQPPKVLVKKESKVEIIEPNVEKEEVSDVKTRISINFCPSCGSNQKGNNFCSNCGMKLL